MVLVQSSEQGVRFTYSPGAMSLQDAGDGRTRVTFEHADNTAEPGQFDLPSRTVRVGVPQTGQVRVRQSTGNVTRLDRTASALVTVISFERGRLEPSDTAARATPSEWVEVTGRGEVRGVRYIELTLHPARFVRDGGLEVTDRIEVSVEFTEPPRDSRNGDRLVAAVLLNGAHAQSWSLDPGNSSTASVFERSPNWLRIAVDSTGIYILTREDLARAGVPVAGLDPRTLSLYAVPGHVPNSVEPETLSEVPIFVTGEEDGRFDRNDRIIFYAQGADYWQPGCSLYTKNLYTQRSRCWLSWGGGPGRRMQRGLAPDTAGTRPVRQARWVVRRERDTDCPARSGLLWTWTYLYKPPGQAEATFETELDLPSPVRVRSIRGRVMSLTGDNRLSVRFNRREVASLTFGVSPASTPFDFRIDSALVCGSRRNTLALGLLGDGTRSAYVDYFDIEYERRLSLEGGRLDFLQDDTGRFRFVVADAPAEAWILDVTRPGEPRLVEDFSADGEQVTFSWRVPRPARFAACTERGLRRPTELKLRRPGRLSAPLAQADYWIITPEEYLGAAERLAEYRTGHIAGVRNARAAVALLEDVYDDYALGMSEPVAVKRFLADKRPQYALLVGDATCDYRGLLSSPRAPGVPPYETGYGLDAETYDRSALAYDAWYADFEGDGGSPDVMLGRVTARSGEELRRFVDKVIAYENEPTGQWANRYLLIADDEFFGVADPNNQRSWDPIRFGHIGTCEYLAALPDNLLQLVKVYLTEYPFAGVKNKPEAHAAVMRELDAGGLVLVFIGHGSGFDLTHESVLNIANVPALANVGRNPFCYFGSCSVGRFDDTQFECIAEELVRIPAGAIASVAATKATTSGSNQVFARNLLTPLFTLPDSTMGYAFFQAWPTDRIYHFFGDPATKLRLPARSGQSLSFEPDTVRPGRRFAARGIVEEPVGRFEWTLFGPRRLRTYRSFLGEANYELPGLELARGTGRVDNGQVEVAGTFPAGAPLDTQFVANGWYAPVTRSVRLRALVSGPGVDLGVMRDTITFSTEPWLAADSAGPQVTFWLDGRQVRDGDVVPGEAELEVRCADSAGVAIVPVTGIAPEAWTNDRRGAVDVSRRLVFEEGSTNRARFALPVRLDGPLDSVFAAVSDNLQNRTVASVRLEPQLSGVLRIESALVYPNPVSGPTAFTFTLTRAATVRVRVYTLAGRLVRDFGTRFAGFGYNEVAWDGRDGEGRAPANGVYLYTLTAELDEGGGKRQRVVVRDRLIVHR